MSSHLTSILSRPVLCGAIAACILDSAATVEAAVALRLRGTYELREHEHSSVVMISVLLVLLIFLVFLAIGWRRSLRAKNLEPRRSWENLEKQSDTPQNETLQNETLQNVELAEPAPAVHSTRIKRSTDTWDKYLSMIKSPSRLNSTVGKMSTA